MNLVAKKLKEKLKTNKILKLLENPIQLNFIKTDHFQYHILKRKKENNGRERALAVSKMEEERKRRGPKGVQRREGQGPMRRDNRSTE